MRCLVVVKDIGKGKQDQHRACRYPLDMQTHHQNMSSVPQFPPPHLIHDNNEGQQQQQTQTRGEAGSSPLALPAPSQASTGVEQSSAGPTGDDAVVKFDKLGPLVVNSDGTLSRIHNWAGMTDAERERTVRVLNKRNQSRMNGLRHTIVESTADHPGADSRDQADDG